MHPASVVRSEALAENIAMRFFAGNGAIKMEYLPADREAGASKW